MKDKWLKDLHDRLSDFEMDTPENLWDDIEKAEKQRIEKSRRPRLVWLRRSVAAAIVIAIAIAAFIRVIDFSSSGFDVDTGIASATNAGQAEKTPIISPSAKQIVVSSIKGTESMAIDKRKLAAIANPKQNTEQVKFSPTDTDTDDTEKEVADTQETLPDATPEHLNHTLQLDRNDNTPYQNNRHDWIASANQHHESHLSIGLYSSGGINSSYNNRSSSDVVLVAGPGGSRWEDSPVLGILLFNQGKEINTEFNHRQPIRAGISLNYNLTLRLSVGTGLSYTNLTSDFKSGSDTHYFSGRQVLHYVGIPLNVSYKIYSWKRLSLYGTAGVLGEKCVYGKKTTDFTVDNTDDGSRREDIEKKPFQFSVNASAGVQLSITNHIGVYAEPGLSYYFNDGTDLKSIYKDKPLNFNFNIGLRFTIK